MKVAKKDRVLEVDEPGMKIYDYALPGVKMGIAYQELEGRIPKEGRGMNTVCDECFYIIEGKAKVFVDDKEYDATAGDVVVLPKGSSSYMVAEKVKMLTLTDPDWFLEQHRAVG